MIMSNGEVLLERRPPTGIWGGLWSFPELALEADIPAAVQLRLGLTVGDVREMPTVDHGFTHFSLTIFPVEITLEKRPSRAMEPGAIWLNIEDAKAAAIPAPVKRILASAKPTQAIKR